MNIDKNSVVVGFSHIDADGILSSAILRDAFPNIIQFFTKDLNYGIGQEDLDNIKKYVEDEFVLICTDLGVDKTSSKTINDNLDSFEKVFIFDHHPLLDENKKLLNNKKINIVHDLDYCGCGVTYTYLKKNNMFVEGLPELWTIIGTYADVYNEVPKSVILLEQLYNIHPEMDIHQIFMSSRNNSVASMYPLPSMLGSYWNIPKRLFYGNGAHVGYNACKDIENHGSIGILYENISGTMKEALYSNLYMLQRWRSVWLDNRGKVFDNMNFYQFAEDNDIGFGICIIDHHWDLGGFVASRKCNDINKPIFVINTGLLIDGIKISARNTVNKKKYKWADNIEFGRFFGICSKLSEGFVDGGGHKFAASGGTPRDYPLDKLISIMVNAWKIEKECWTNDNKKEIKKYIIEKPVKDKKENDKQKPKPKLKIKKKKKV